MEQWLRHIRPKVTLSIAFVLLLSTYAPCSAQTLSQILAQTDEHSASISTLSATIISTNSMGRTFETRVEFKRPGLWRTEFFPTGKNYPITVTQLTETALWKTFPRSGAATRENAPSVLPWNNDAITFLAIFLSPSHALGGAQFVANDTTPVEGDNSFVMRISELPSEFASTPQERPKQISCWIDRADLKLRKIKVKESRLQGARQLVAEEWKEVAPGLFVPLVFESSMVDIPERQAMKLRAMGIESPVRNTAKYHVKDIRINEPIADARFQPTLDGTLLVTDAKPLSADEYKKRIDSEPDNADLYFNLGKVYLNNGTNLADAEKAFHKTIALRPRAKAGYAVLRRLYSMVKKDRESEELLEKSVALFPDDPDLHRALSRLYERARKFDRAIEELRKKIAIEPDPVIDEYGMAELLYKSGDFDEAVRMYRWILDNDLPPPRNMDTSVASRLVQMHEQALRLDELEEAFREIVEGKDAKKISLKILTDVYIAAGKRKEAATTWRRLAAQTDTENSELLLNLAERFRAKKMLAEATEVCEHLIGSVKDQYTLRRAHDILASTRQPPEQEDELLAFYKETLSANFGLNDWWKAANWLTTFYEQQGELDTFIDELSELLDKNPGDSALYSCLVIAQKRNNDYAGAIEALKEQLEIRAPGVKFSFALAKTYEEAGLNDEAVEAYTWLTQQKQQSGYAYGPLVALLYRIGRADQANQAIERAKRNLPRDGEWCRIIADLYESVENRESAETLYLEAIEGAPEIVYGHHGNNDWGQGSKLGLRHLLAKRYADWGDLPKAEEQYRIVIGKTKDDTYGRIAVKQLVEMLRETDDLESTLERNELLLNTLKEQLKTLQSAVATDPANGELAGRAEQAQSAFIEQSVYLVAVYQEDKQLAKVVPVYEAVVEALPEDSDTWVKLAEACDRAGLLEKAAETYEKLIEISPDRRKNFLYRLKSLYMRARNTEDVLRVAGQLIAEYGDADAYRAAAHMYEDLEMPEKALEHFQHALALDEDPRMRSDDRLSIAIVYRVLEDYERSRRMYETILAEPATEYMKQRAREELDEVLKMMGKNSEATSTEQHTR